MLFINIFEQVRSWEKQYQQIFDETDATKLSSMADKAVLKYFNKLPQPGWKER